MDAVMGFSAAVRRFAYIIWNRGGEAESWDFRGDVATCSRRNDERPASVVLGRRSDHRAAEGRGEDSAGCTIDGIVELEEGKLRVTLIKAVVKATSRAGELLLRIDYYT